MLRRNRFMRMLSAGVFVIALLVNGSAIADPVVKLNNSMLSIDNLGSSKNSSIEIVNLLGKQVYFQNVSGNTTSFSLDNVLSRCGKSPLIVKLSFDGKSTIKVLSYSKKSHLTLSDRIQSQSADATLDGNKVSSGLVANEHAYMGQGVTRQGTLDGNPIEFRDVNGLWIYDGDIILQPESGDESGLAKEYGTGRSNSGSRWPNRTIPYTINSNLSGKTQRITDAIAIYNRLGFYFVERGSQSDYIEFKRDTSGTYSKIGKVGGKQVIGLADWATYGNTMHEMGHALGLFHEQSRADQSSWIKVFSSNVKSGSINNFQTYTAQGSDGFDFHNFDWTSMMLYDSYAFAVDASKPTMTLTDGKTTWSVQRRGPSIGDITTLTRMYPQNYIAHTSVASLSGNRLDVFRVDGSGNVQTAAWDQTVSSGAWRGWWSIANGKTASGGNVTGLTRSTLKLDVFTVGTDNKVYTAAWDHYVSSGAWRGWWNIPGITLDGTTTITPVSRDPNKLDIFAVGTDGFAYTAAWDQNVSSGAWRGWWKIGTRRLSSATSIEAISRDANSLDVFSIGDNGNLYYSKWTQAQVSWSEWTDLGNPGQWLVNVTAVKSASNRMHVFAVGLDGTIYSREWSSASSPNWTAWSQVAGGVAARGAKVVATSRATGYVDAFVFGTDYNLYTCAWQSGVDARNTYRGWWNIGNTFTQGTQLSCAGRNATSLDVFAISGNGGAVWTTGWTSAAGWTAWKKLP